MESIKIRLAQLPKSPHILPILLVVVALIARILPGPRIIDDSYITYRYAVNLLSGNGFVFNPGEQVQGTTTPLYAFLMTVLGALTGGSQAPFPYLALFVNAISDAVTCVLIFHLGKRLNHTAAGAAAALVWSIAPFSVTFAIGGLETSLYIALLTGMVWAHLNQKRKTAALLAILSILTRPDAILLVGPVIIDRLYHHFFKAKKIRIVEFAIFLLPGLAWGIFSTLYFGSPIPHSVSAKLEVYRLEPASSFIRLIQHYSLLFMQNNILGNLWGIGLGLVFVPFFYILGAIAAFKANRQLFTWMIYPWLYLIVFAIPNPLIFRWYLAPPMVALIFFFMIGLEKAIFGLSHSISSLGTSLGRKFLVFIFLFVFPAGFSLSDWNLHPDHGSDRPAPGMAFIQLELLYQQAADKIIPFTNPTTSLAAGDVGVLGFFTQAQILDTVGLNSPVSLSYYPLDTQYYVINYAIPTSLILDQKPDWLVVLEVYGRKTFLENPEFNSRYTLWDTLPTDMYGSNGMLIFHRSDLGIPKAK